MNNKSALLSRLAFYDLSVAASRMMALLPENERQSCSWKNRHMKKALPGGETHMKNTLFYFVLVCCLFLGRLRALDTHEKPTLEIRGGSFGLGSAASPDYSDSTEPYNHDTGKPMDFDTGCINFFTGVFLNCETTLRIYYGKPFDMTDPDLIHEWSGGHDHSGDGDDATRPIGGITSTMMDDNPNPLVIHGFTENNKVVVTKTMPKITGTITISLRSKLPPNFIPIPNAHWSLDPDDPLGKTQKAAFKYVVKYPEIFAELPSFASNYLRCGLVSNCLVNDTENTTHKQSFMGKSALRDSIAEFASAYSSQHHEPFFESDPAKWTSFQILKFRDMSLPWGGLFDYQQFWTTPHHYHRVGIAVDVVDDAVLIDTTVTPNSRANIGVDKRSFYIILLQNGLKLIKEDANLHVCLSPCK